MAQIKKPELGDGNWASRYTEAPYNTGLLPISTKQAEFLEWYSNQYLHNLSLTVDIFGAWLTGGRNLIDAWRDSVRNQQDSMLSGLRQQIQTHAKFSQQALPEDEPLTAPSAQPKGETRTARRP